MVRQITTRILKNGYKIVSETFRGKMGGNPQNEINTIISVFDDLGKLIVKRDKTVLKNTFGDSVDYLAGKVPKDYRDATSLFSKTYYPTNNSLGGITVNKQIVNYSGLYKKTTGSIELPGHGNADWGQTHVKQLLEERFEPTPAEFSRIIRAEARGAKYDTSQYPQFLKNMITNSLK